MLSKYKATDADWRRLLREAPALVSPAEVENLADDALAVLREHLRGKRAAVAYSAGKDGIVALDLARRACPDVPAVQCVTGLEYPFWLRWCREHLPAGTDLVQLTELDEAWLRAHPRYLFPTRNEDILAWYGLTHWRVQNEAARDRKLDFLITGRRVKDGNFCGKRGQYLVENGTKSVLNPIRDWSHEQLFAYIDHRGLALPPWYDLPDAFESGPNQPNMEHGTSAVYYVATPSEDDKRAHRHRALKIVEARDAEVAGRLLRLCEELDLL